VSSETFVDPSYRFIFRSATGAIIVLGLLLTTSLFVAAPLLASIPILVGGAAVWATSRCYRRPVVRVSVDGVLVRNPFSEAFASWPSVESIALAPAFGGAYLTIALRNGERIRAWAVQGPRFPGVGRSHFADGVVRRLEDYRTQEQ
jgi:hypothetical protein